jgi:hypothetical protein
MIEQSGRESQWRSNVAAYALVVLFVGFISVEEIRGEGGLTWDDAEYLTRGYDCVRYARSKPGNAGIQVARVGWTLLHQGFKPPLLVTWTVPWFYLLGPEHLSLVIWFASALPFALLLIAAARVAALTFGARAAPLAVLCVAASPLALEFGSKVMVETFLGLWILLALHEAARFLVRPTYSGASLLGLWAGLALLTKFTALVLLGGPVLYFLWIWFREPRRIGLSLGLLATCATVVLVVAGPWYARNYQNVLDHARYASQFDELALGKSDESMRILRVPAAAGAIAGWFVVLTAVVAEILIATRKHALPAALPASRHLERLALLGLLVSTIVLLFPSYFELRFLLPAWPAVEVVVGGRCCQAVESLGSRGGYLFAGLLALSSIYALVTVDRELVDQRSRTYLDAGAAVAELAKEHGVRSVANLGDAPDWNVFKLRLASRLRPEAAQCEFRDVSKFSSEELTGSLKETDAIFVLDHDQIPPLMLQTPAMNRAYDSISAALKSEGFEPVKLTADLDLPPVIVYVRKR